MSLRPCVACSRHLRPAEGKCPFCGSLAAAAIAIGLAFAACGGNAAEPAPTPGPSLPSAADARPERPERGDIYGVPQQRDAAPAPPTDARPAGPDAGRGPAAPIYGVPDDPPAPVDARQAKPPRPRPEKPDLRPEPLYGVPSDQGPD